MPKISLGLCTRRSRNVHVPRPRRGVEQGDAFYVPPGHTPAHEAGNELLLFSPTAELEATKEALHRGVQHLDEV